MLTFTLSGKLLYRLRSWLTLLWSSLMVPVRRLFYGPFLPGWPLTFELAYHFMKSQQRFSTKLEDVREQRAYMDSLVFALPANITMTTQQVNNGEIKGCWYIPSGAPDDRAMLYLHGGGYAFYAKFYHSFIAQIALSARIRVFVPDYRLVPEHPFPAQLEDALSAYRWLIEQGIEPGKMVIGGDSAGGNLTMALLLALRNLGSQLPALAVLLCPWVDLGNSGKSILANEPFDWITGDMAREWSYWHLKGHDPCDPLASPVYADLRGLPPIYMQAGEKEILFDMIETFANRAKQQGADITFETWENMVHDFQAFAEIAPQSMEALRRIGEVVWERV